MHLQSGHAALARHSAAIASRCHEASGTRLRALVRRNGAVQGALRGLEILDGLRDVRGEVLVPGRRSEGPERSIRHHLRRCAIRCPHHPKPRPSSKTSNARNTKSKPLALPRGSGGAKEDPKDSCRCITSADVRDVPEGILSPRPFADAWMQSFLSACIFSVPYLALRRPKSMRTDAVLRLRSFLFGTMSPYCLRTP